jgi:Enoyl-(Acyl carrier protein) reductase
LDKPDKSPTFLAKARYTLPRRGERGIGSADGAEPWRRPVRWDGQRPPLIPMGTTGTPADIGHCIAWISSDSARLITGCDFVVDGGARARNFMYIPPEPERMAGPAPPIALDETVLDRPAL